MFTSIWFLVLLLAVTLAWYNVPPTERWIVALAGSGIFYLTMGAAGAVPLLFSAGVVWYAAGRLKGRRGSIWLAGAAAACLLPLFTLKYVAAGLHGFLVPLGISYYTLQLLGYLLDVWHERLTPEKNFGKVLCYAVFFLSIVQGPFNRYGELMPQMERRLPFERRRLVFALQRMAWGYFQKYAVAEPFAVAADTILERYAVMDRSQLIFGVVAYSIQLYADFAGYTNIALGAAELLGLRLSENFRQPYFAQSVSDFWRRWHISLSDWFRDYVYIPLGGNRKGTARKLLNLAAVWMLTGIWHGLSSNYLAWGAYYAVLLAGTTLLYGVKGSKSRPSPWPVRVMRAMRTSLLAGFGWLLFRADSLAMVGNYLACIAQKGGNHVFTNYWEMGVSSRTDLLMLLVGVVALLVVDIQHERGVSFREKLAGHCLAVRWLVYQVFIWSFLLMGLFLRADSFLYARF